MQRLVRSPRRSLHSCGNASVVRSCRPVRSHSKLRCFSKPNHGRRRSRLVESTLPATASANQRESATTVKQLSESTINEWKAEFAKQREQLQPHLEALQASIKDVEAPVPPNASPFLLKSYLWAAVCLAVSGVARVIGGLFLYGIVGAIFDTWTSVLLTFVVLPAFVFMNVRKVQMTETQREQLVLFGSVALGALIGTLFSDRYATIYGPPTFLLPLCIGLLAHFAGAKEQVAGNRRVFLGALLGGAVAGYVVYGIIFNLSLSYIVSVIILSGAALVDLQLKVASFQRGDSSPQLEQWKTVVILSVAGSIAHFLASTTDQQAATQAQESS